MGTLTKRNTPEQLSPIGNPIVYTMSYDTPSDTGFYWLTDIYTTEKISRLKKQAVYDEDIFFDVSRFLNLSYDFNPNIASWATAPNSLIKYYVKDGYHTTSAGDQISNRLEHIAFNGSLDRDKFLSFNCLDYVMGVEAPFTGTSQYAGKFLTYFDNRNVSLSDYGTLSFFNGRELGTYWAQIQFIFIKTNYSTGEHRYYYIESPYVGSTTDGEERIDVGIYPANINALSTIKWQAFDDTLTINSVSDGSMVAPAYAGKTALYLSGNLDDLFSTIGTDATVTGTILYNGTFDILSYWFPNILIIDTPFLGNDTGECKAPYRVHTGPAITDSVTSYEVFAQYVAQIVSPIYTFNLRSSCTTRTPYQVAWLNPLGAFEYFTFYGSSDKEISTESQTYTKKLGSLDGYDWGYNNEDFEEIKYNNLITTSYILRTDWIDYNEQEKIVELIESPVVFMSTDEGSNWTSINITTDSIKIQTKQDKLVSYEIETRLSHKNKRQLR